MAEDKGSPARFLLRNSRGRPDFLMTMLVVMVLALLVSVLFFMMINYLSLRGAGAGTNEQVAESLRNFNDNVRLIILGICSSVFSLAGAYYLRRKAYDEHYESYTQTKASLGALVGGGSLPSVSFAEPSGSTLTHPNYDDEEEDI